MSVFTFPELYCPFPSKVNKYADVLEDYAIEWVSRFNMLANESSIERFRKSKFFLLTSGAYPSSKLEELRIANDLLSWLFIWDDQCDLSDIGKQPEVLNDFHNKFLDILRGAKITSQDIPISHALNNLRQRILQKSTEEWFVYFYEAFEDYFNGCLLESKNRKLKIIPDIDTYIKLRRSSLGLEQNLIMSELCNQFILSKVLRRHEILKKLKYMAIDILAWCNDIFSASREIATGDVHNLVFLLHYHEEISLDEAMKRAAQMHDQKVKEMISLEASLPSFGEKLDVELSKYISGLHTWISSNLNWYAYSGRYESLKRLELVKC
ncbi:MAG: terpene synthase [Scytonematopsis contorta HA4267-MV1]|jgi:5-epi-alpha-selinene synthase|nr:terpene synthase [Scytonematopsis contorta HA4267-MV1]